MKEKKGKEKKTSFNFFASVKFFTEIVMPESVISLKMKEFSEKSFEPNSDSSVRIFE